VSTSLGAALDEAIGRPGRRRRPHDRRRDEKRRAPGGQAQSLPRLPQECSTIATRISDAVLVATPDHNPRPRLRSGPINLGKATFCQKPLAHNIYECYALAKAAAQHKVPTQMGNPRTLRRTDPPRGGVYLGGGGWQRRRNAHDPGAQLRRQRRPARQQAGAAGRPLGRVARPGALPRLPRRPAPVLLALVAPISARGTIGDMACHHVDGPFLALKIGEVKQFTVECLAKTGGSEEMVLTRQHRPLRDPRSLRHAARQGLRLRSRRPEAADHKKMPRSSAGGNSASSPFTWATRG